MNVHSEFAAIVLLKIVLFVCLSAGCAFADSTESQVVSRAIHSSNIAKNKIGTNPIRNILIYLPAGYRSSTSQRYPVVYFLPNPFQAGYWYDFDHRGAQALFDQAIAARIIGNFILVAGDMYTPLGAAWDVNSPATGDWGNFVTEELVPYIDANFRTRPDRSSRGIAGIFIGG